MRSPATVRALGRRGAKLAPWFCVNLTQAGVRWEEGTSAEKVSRVCAGQRAQLTVGDAIPEQVAEWYRKQAEQASGSKSVSSSPPWLLLQLLSLQAPALTALHAGR